MSVGVIVVIGRLAGALAVGALAASVAACAEIGPVPHRFAPAISPRGADVRLVTSDSTVLARGELVAVSDSVVVLDYGKRLLRLPPSAFALVDVKGLGRFHASPARWRGTVAAVRPVSRFPQGLTPELEQRLLASRR